MNQDELIEKCRLRDEELYQFEDDFAQLSWQIRQYPYEPVMNFAYTLAQKIAEAQLRKAIPIIEAEARRRSKGE